MENLIEEKEYFSHGELKRKYCVDEYGRKQGKETLYYAFEGGQIKKTLEYTDNMLNGYVINYRKNGEIKSIKRYSYGTCQFKLNSKQEIEKYKTRWYVLCLKKELEKNAIAEKKTIDALTPDYYQLPNGIRCEDIVAYFPMFRGNAIKYLWRAGKKNKDTEIEDLKKAIQCIEIELKRLGGQ